MPLQEPKARPRNAEFLQARDAAIQTRVATRAPIESSLAGNPEEVKKEKGVS